MPLETFHGPDPTRLLTAAHAALGDDAVVLGVRRTGPRAFELTATDPLTAARLAPRAWPAPFAPLPSHPELALADRRVIALVGPTGAGKTTTIAKLLHQPDEIAGRVGVLTLDTHRAGACAQTRALAKLGRARFAVAHQPGDLARAVRALNGCRTLLVDTAGRGPARADDQRDTWALLAALRPAEVHLTVPAGLSPARARRILAEYRSRVTHLLVTKLDECPEELAWFELAAELRVPLRWVADGQDLTRDLRRSSEWRVGGEPAAAVPVSFEVAA